MAFGQGRGGGGRGRGDKKTSDKEKGQRRTLFRRRKVCKFCADKIDDINYKDVKLLGPFVPERGKVLPRRISGTCAMHQRKLQVAIERERAKLDVLEAEEQKVAGAIAERMSGVEIEIARKVGETEALYGSVTTADIAEALHAKGFDIDRRKLQLHEPIKKLGEYDVPVKLHRDVATHVKVRVVAEAAEAKKP